MRNVHGNALGADMYLAVRSARSGDIKGEAVASGHVDEIVVRGWSWGMAANSDAALRSSGGGGPARYSVRQLHIDKSLDRASTSLLSVVKANDKVKTAVLSMRKAGEGQQDFLKVTLEDARLTDIDLVADPDGNVIERLTFTFAKASMEYRVQQGSGLVGATSSFDVDA